MRRVASLLSLLAVAAVGSSGCGDSSVSAPAAWDHSIPDGTYLQVLDKDGQLLRELLLPSNAPVAFEVGPTGSTEAAGGRGGGKVIGDYTTNIANDRISVKALADNVARGRMTTAGGHVDISQAAACWATGTLPVGSTTINWVLLASAYRTGDPNWAYVPVYYEQAGEWEVSHIYSSAPIPVDPSFHCAPAVASNFAEFGFCCSRSIDTGMLKISGF